MARLSIALEVRDVDGGLIVDPVAFLRLARLDGVGSVELRVDFRGEPLERVISDGPPGTPLTLRLIPGRFRTGAVLCSVDGDGTLTPLEPIVLPRSPSEWLPAFIGWQSLDASFDPLKELLEESPRLQMGRLAPPGAFVRDGYDGVDPANTSSVLAKMCLLNLYSRLSTERAPDHDDFWFAFSSELLLATQERIIAEVSSACFDLVHDLAVRGREGYRKAKSDLHVKNFNEIPGVSGVERVASVKTRPDKGSLQFTVARVQRDGRAAFLLDADIDENAKLIPHFFDLVKHFFTGGTHPIDVHDALRLAFADVALGYRLEPRQPVGEVRARVIAVGEPVP